MLSTALLPLVRWLSRRPDIYSLELPAIIWSSVRSREGIDTAMCASLAIHLYACLWNKNIKDLLSTLFLSPAIFLIAFDPTPHFKIYKSFINGVEYKERDHTVWWIISQFSFVRYFYGRKVINVESSWAQKYTHCLGLIWNNFNSSMNTYEISVLSFLFSLSFGIIINPGATFWSLESLNTYPLLCVFAIKKST